MRLPRDILPLLIALFLGACSELTDPTKPAVTSELGADLTLADADGGLLQFLAPHTMVRESGRPETVDLPIAGLDFSHVMDPFVLRVRTVGGSSSNPVVGSVFLNGATVLGPAELATGDAFDLEIALTPTSALSVQLLGPPGSQLTAWIEAAPQPPPVITIHSPARGAMLMQGLMDVSLVEISGQACHVAYPITALVVNGVAVPVSGESLCEPFTVAQDSRWGMSSITARAENARGRSGSSVQSYLRSPNYFPAALDADPAARVPAAARGQLSQILIDDFDRSDIDDMGTLLERTAAALDVNATIPDPILNDLTPTRHYDCLLFSVDNFRSGFKVTKRSAVTAVPAGFSLIARTDGLHVTTSITEIHAPVTIQGYLDLGCAGNPTASVNGTYTASAVSGDLPLELGTGPTGPHIAARSAVVQLSGASFNPDMGIFEFMSFLVDPMIDAVLTILKSDVESGIGSGMGNVTASVLEGLFARYTVASDVAVNGAALQSESVVDHLTSATGTLRLGVAAQIRPARPPAAPPASVFGSIRSAAAPPALPASPYATSLSDDLVNQLLWSAWQAGAFKIGDVAAYTGTTVTGLALSLDATLPPVVMPGGGAPMVDAGIGDLRITGTVDPAEFGLAGLTPPAEPVPFVAYASVVAGLTLDYETASHRLDVANLEAQVSLDLSSLPAFIDEEALAPHVAAGVEATVARVLPEAIAAVPLPILDLADLSGLPPAFLQFGSATIGRVGSYTILSGTVR